MHLWDRPKKRCHRDSLRVDVTFLLVKSTIAVDHQTARCSSMRFLFSSKFRIGVDRYFTPESLRELLFRLSEFPTSGKLMSGYSGVRKLRFPDRLHQRGQRGGLRIVYRYDSVKDVILLYFAYRKTDQTDILPHQREYIFQTQITDFIEGDLWEIRKN